MTAKQAHDRFWDTSDRLWEQRHAKVITPAQHETRLAAARLAFNEAMDAIEAELRQRKEVQHV